MARVELELFAEDHRDAVARFNDRLRDAGAAHRIFLPQRPTAPEEASSAWSEALYLLLSEGEVRAGAYLRQVDVHTEKGRVRMGWIKHPVAESVADRKHAQVPSSLLFGLREVQPNLGALGMGGPTGQFARLLQAMRWSAAAFPLLALPVQPARLLRHLDRVQQSGWKRLIGDLAVLSGFAPMAGALLRATAAYRYRSSLADSVVGRGDTLNPVADAVWDRCCTGYPALVLRDAAALALRYPATNTSLRHLSVSRNGQTVGWVMVQYLDLTQLSDQSDYGPIRLGTIVDVLALPSDSAAVLAAGCRQLQEEGADLVLAVFSDERWITSARRLGFFALKDRFACSFSPPLAKLLGPRDGGMNLFLARGDDGLYSPGGAEKSG